MNNYKRREEEFWNEVFVRGMTTIAFIFIVVITIIVVYGNKVVSEITYVSVPVQRIPVKEMLGRYVDSLPVPKAEYPTLMVQKESLEEVVITEENANVLTNNSKPKEKNVEYVKPENLIQEVENITPIITTLNTSAYCSCEICCGKTDGKTASGKMATAWHTVAAGNDYPIGTIIYIPALVDKPNGGWFVVEDRGGAISNEKLDVFFNTHEEAIQFGRKSLEAYIYIPND